MVEVNALTVLSVIFGWYAMIIVIVLWERYDARKWNSQWEKHHDRN